MYINITWIIYIYIIKWIWIWKSHHLIQEPIPHTHTHTHTHTMPHLSLDSAVLLFDSGVLLAQKQKTSFTYTHTHTPSHTDIPTYVLNRKSETYVPLNILLGIRHAMNRHLQVRTRTKEQIRRKYTYFYVKKLSRKKSYANKVLWNCKIYVFLLFLGLQKYNLYHIMCPYVSNL